MPRKKKECPNRKDGLYEIKITIGKTVDGKLIRKSFYSSISKSDARKRADEYIINQKASEMAGIQQTETSTQFDVWAQTWLVRYKRGNVKETTYKDTYEGVVNKYLTPFFGNMQLRNIKPIDVQTLYNQLSEKYHKSTLQKVKLCLNAIYETAIENDLCYKNPAKHVSYSIKNKSAVRSTYTQEEVDNIVNILSKHECGIGVIIMLKMGLRRSELAGLMWSDIDFENKTMRIERAVTDDKGKAILGDTKSKTSKRMLPIEDSTISILKQFYDKIKPQSTDYIIHNRHDSSKCMSPSNYYKTKYKKCMSILAENNIRNLNPHECRHTCGTLLYEKTNDIYAVSKFLGHSDVSITTKLYIHENVETLRNALQID